MTDSKRYCAIAAVLALAGCDMTIDTTEDNKATEQTGAETQVEAEANMVSIDAPGVDIKVALPQGIRTNMNADNDSALLYPGSTLSGVHIAAGEGTGDGAVEIRFTNPDAPDKIAAWYRETAGTDYTIDSAVPEGNGFVINGHQTDDNSAFTITLDSKDGGGTVGRLSVSGNG